MHLSIKNTLAYSITHTSKWRIFRSTRAYSLEGFIKCLEDNFKTHKFLPELYKPKKKITAHIIKTKSVKHTERERWAL